jgi:hypothetical protein
MTMSTEAIANDSQEDFSRNAAAERIRLVWSHTQSTHYRWLNDLLGDLVAENIVGQHPIVAQPYTIYAIKTTKTPLSSLPISFYESLAVAPGVGLFVGSDEWLDDDYEYYKRFAYVIRLMHGARFRNTGILTLPLGYGGDQLLPECRPAASERRYLWSFVGKPVGSRPEMLRWLVAARPNYAFVPGWGGVGERDRIDYPDYQRLLADSAFAPAPMGNVMLETHRVYEALEHGAIPIVERRPLIDYFSQLFGRHPLPTVRSWSRARDLMDDWRRRPEAIDALQREILHWWAEEKASWRVRAQEFVRRGMRGELKGELAAWNVTSNRVLRRLAHSIELARHHSLPAVGRRLGVSIARWKENGPVIAHRAHR